MHIYQYVIVEMDDGEYDDILDHGVVLGLDDKDAAVSASHECDLEYDPDTMSVVVRPFV